MKYLTESVEKAVFIFYVDDDDEGQGDAGDRALFLYDHEDGNEQNPFSEKIPNENDYGDHPDENGYGHEKRLGEDAGGNEFQ